MKEVRAPFAYTAFKQLGATANELRSSIGFEAGFRIKMSDLLAAAERYELDMQELMPDVRGNINLRFQEKLRGNLASYLFENDGAFRGKTSDSQMRALGLDSWGEVALPNRVIDAIHLEELLNTIIAQAQAMQKMIDQKFNEAEHKIIFRTQCAPGMFRLRARYPGSHPSRSPQAPTRSRHQSRKTKQPHADGKQFTVEGVRYRFLSEVARSTGVSYQRLYRHVKALNTPLADMTPDQWAECINRSLGEESSNQTATQISQHGQNTEKQKR